MVSKRLAFPSLPLLLMALGLASSAAAQTTIVIDGVNDFEPGQAFAGGEGSVWYFAFDASHFYFGLTQSDLGLASAERFVTLYLDTDPQTDPLTGAGTTTGVLYNTQQPLLPFRADVHLRWRADGAFEEALVWSGTSWVSASTDLVAAWSLSTQYVELAISRADLGSPSSVSLIGSLVFEAPFLESSSAFAPPSTSAGYDPDPLDFLSLPLFTATPVPALGLGGAALLLSSGLALGCLRSRARTGAGSIF